MPSPPESRSEAANGVRSHIALYPGSFDPPTLGHIDVIKRGRQMFDRLIVGVGRNPDKSTLFSVDERVRMLKTLTEQLCCNEPDGAPVIVTPYEGLTVDAAKQLGASILLRGVRNLNDMQYEAQQAVTNRQLSGLETAFVMAGQSFAYVSSTLIRQVTAMGSDPSVLASMCPPLVIDALLAKKRENHEVLRRTGGGPGN
ncbi:MAG: pantetheine-phosphate adenylyltransferase [Phycisphaerales bacterium]